MMRCFCGYVGGYPIFRCPACHRLLINPSQVKEGVPVPWGSVVRAMERTLSRQDWEALPDALPDGTPKRAIWYRHLGTAEERGVPAETATRKKSLLVQNGAEERGVPADAR